MLVRRRDFGLGLLLATAAMLLPSSRKASAHSDHGSPADLEIIVGEFYFRGPAGKNGPLHIQSGRPHLIRFENEGQLEHEVHFGRDPDIEAGLYRENLFGPPGFHQAHGFLGLHLPAWLDESEPKPFGVLHVWIPRGMEGEWELGCFIPGHYEAGQHAPVLVVPGPGA